MRNSIKYLKIRMFSFGHDTKWSCGWHPIAQLHAGAVRLAFSVARNKKRTYVRCRGSAAQLCFGVEERQTRLWRG
jgi:hypothetical protein